MDAAWFALGMLLVVGCAVAVAWLLRGAEIWGGPRSAAIAGGILAGLLCGPTILGRLAPGAHARLYTGGVDEARVYEELLDEQAREREALRATGVTGAAERELASEHERERGPLAEALESARGRRAGSLTTAASLAAGAALLLAGACRRRRGRRTTQAADLTAAVLLTAVAGGVASLLLPVREAALFAACAATLGPATLGALPPALLGALAAPVPGVAAVALAAALAWALARLPVPADTARSARAALDRAALPGVVALAVLHVDLHLLLPDWRFWVASVLAVLVSNDGRWAAVWLARRAACFGARKRSGLGRRGRWREASGALAADASTGQCAWAAALLAAGAITPSAAFALLFAAWLVDASGRLRRLAAVVLDRGLRPPPP